MASEFCGSSLLLALPDDVFAIISRSLSPRDLCNLSLCCQSLCTLVAAEKVWLTQSEILGVVPHRDLIEWRKGVSSYKALCRFLVTIKPLIGIWVHQNPELGNVVYVMPGFVSIVGCRIIPQELGPLGIEEGPILWAPVFEIIGDLDGSLLFFLHGREKSIDYMYPGSVKPLERNCNILLLEVEPLQQKSGSKLLQIKSFDYLPDKELSRKISRSNSDVSRSKRLLEQSDSKVPFSRLNFVDRRKLIEVVTVQVRQTVPDSANGPLFPHSRNDEDIFKKDMALLFERRSLLLRTRKINGGCVDWQGVPELPSDPAQSNSHDTRKSLNCSNGLHGRDDDKKRSISKKTVRGYFTKIFWKSPSLFGNYAHSRSSSSSSENKHASLHEFLKSGDAIRLTLRASTARLTSYRAWPNMHDNRYALYKLPIRVPTADQEYAGLWGGTFGWPPGKPTEDKSGKALFFLLISYEESEGQRHLIATKILEGTHYVLHPNGSAMFIVNVDEPSEDPFPWDVDGDSSPVIVRHAFAGEGIANGYGFRYPGSKPGSLFVIENGLLAFIWTESRVVLTMQRLNLQELLRKGEQVPALPPIANFSYLTKSYSNVFTGFPNAPTCLSSPRFDFSS
ncbi:hypothetical protein K2173_011979 [Erythroxylum novogranatense]|uniref:F-box domain-containing protein n=1 Tax=Erythroxylum novogranatense TaxID=1862640 RepID=A0AAV8TEJ5_9ROSI|nr:hypothetical protein K2173_011979 [Erythroxylum novogranatense]